MTTVGSVTETIGGVYGPEFQWHFTPQSLTMEHKYWSPIFRISDSSWCIVMRIFQGVVGMQRKCIELLLCRRDPKGAKKVTYYLGIETGRYPRDVMYTNTCFFMQNMVMGNNPFERDFYFPWKGTYGHSFIVFCGISRCETFRLVKEESVSCAVQKEVPHSVDKEKPKDENLSPLDSKGITLLSDRMKNLLIKGSDYDVKICVKDKEFRAHRIILSTRSPVFAMMLKHDTEENKSSTIRIEDCDPESFDEFLLYLYTGRTQNLTPDKALQLYYPGDKYDFPILKEWCVTILKSSLSVTSICDVILLAARHQEKELLEVATDYFARNMKEILLTVNWQTFMTQNPVEANEVLIKSTDILIPKK